MKTGRRQSTQVQKGCRMGALSTFHWVKVGEDWYIEKSVKWRRLNGLEWSESVVTFFPFFPIYPRYICKYVPGAPNWHRKRSVGTEVHGLEKNWSARLKYSLLFRSNNFKYHSYILWVLSLTPDQEYFTLLQTYNCKWKTRLQTSRTWKCSSLSRAFSMTSVQVYLSMYGYMIF